MNIYGFNTRPTNFLYADLAWAFLKDQNVFIRLNKYKSHFKCGENSTVGELYHGSEKYFKQLDKIPDEVTWCERFSDSCMKLNWTEISIRICSGQFTDNLNPNYSSSNFFLVKQKYGVKIVAITIHPKT